MKWFQRIKGKVSRLFKPAGSKKFPPKEIWEALPKESYQRKSLLKVTGFIEESLLKRI